MKGNGRVGFTTTLSQGCDFIDYLNENPAFKSYDRVELNKFKNKFYTFDTFNNTKRRETVTININDIKAFEIPYCSDKDNRDDLSKYMVMEWRNKR